MSCSHRIASRSHLSGKYSPRSQCWAPAHVGRAVQRGGKVKETVANPVPRSQEGVDERRPQQHNQHGQPGRCDSRPLQRLEGQPDRNQPPQRVGRGNRQEHPDFQVILEQGVHPPYVAFDGHEIDADYDERRHCQHRNHKGFIGPRRFRHLQDSPTGHNDQREERHHQYRVPVSRGRHEHTGEDKQDDHRPEPSHVGRQFLARPGSPRQRLQVAPRSRDEISRDYEKKQPVNPQETVNGSAPPGRVEAVVERLVMVMERPEQQHAQDKDAGPHTGERPELAPRRRAHEDCGHANQPQHENHVRGIIPTVDGPQRAQRQRRGNPCRRRPRPRSAAQARNQGQPEAQGQQSEWNHHHVRVQVGKEEGEERKLRYVPR